jgi:peptide/nickel transport system substrate-binding protein
MTRQHKLPATRRKLHIGALGWLVVLIVIASCDKRPESAKLEASATLRVGIGGLPQKAQQAGLSQVVANFSTEGLINLNEDGRPRPFLAESWIQAPDGLTLTLQLRSHAKFHDGSPVTASAISQALNDTLPSAMRSAFEDVADISPVDDTHVRIRLHRPSPFVLEALETTLQKPGKTKTGSGAFAPTAAPFELRANADYYGGRPSIDRIALTSYPSVRTAWAELLRGNLDMLWEVNVDALDSLEGSTDVGVFSFVRHYQYMIVFSPTAAQLQSPEIRRELSAAINRDALVRDALNGHGIPSTGPVPPKHWALDTSAPRLTFDAALARKLASRHLHFTCLVPADSVYERMALAIKQQFAAAGVDMRVEEATQDQVVAAAKENKYEAIVADLISGPSLFRSYRHFNSKMEFSPKPIVSAAIDAALDRIRHARTDDDYRAGVTAFQQAVVDDPPALFLAWGERARAVSRRFTVPAQEKGRDVLATIRLWRPAGVPQVASRN